MDALTVNPLKLPFVSLAERGQLPRLPGIYFALDEADTLIYIGLARNLFLRWRGTAHHRYAQLMATGGIRLAYLLIDDESMLATVEVALIKRFAPAMNQRQDVPKRLTARAPLARFQLVISEDVGEEVAELASKENRSISNMLARLVEEGLALRGA
jgi:hypothetical protein